MKTCVMTNYSTTLNYGAILQAYALNRVINRLGSKCDTVDYAGSGTIDSRKRAQLIAQKIKRGELSGLFDAVLKRRKRSMIEPKIAPRRQSFAAFREAIPHTERCTGRDYQNVINRYDIAVCGSDQIWRPSQAGNLVDAFWLSGIDDHVKKVAYAASMGLNRLPSHCEETARRYLKSFSHIGVREESAQSYYSTLTGRSDIELVPDPVFLLERDDWATLADEGNSSLKSKRYVFVYMIHGSKQLMKGIEKFARSKDAIIVSFPFMNYQFNALQARFGQVRDFHSSPQGWIRLLKDADFVFTDSFHACAFSILFEKEFYVSSANERAFSRIKTLVNSCGVQGRVVPADGLSLKEYEAVRGIDWKIVEKGVEELRTRGIDFLQRSVLS